MQYREFQPRAPLSHYVECFWTLEGNANGEAEPDLVLPDGCAEMILNFREPFCEFDENRDRRRQPMRFFAGQLTRPMRIAPAGATELIGIRFHPGGTQPFIKVPMDELKNRITLLNDVASAVDRGVVGPVGNANTFEQRIAALEETLLRCLLNSRPLNGSIDMQVGRVLTSNGRITVDRLAAEAGLSSRQLERRFLTQVGIGPKLLCRILRFQQVFRAVDQNDSGWASIAADCGYYDQSHLIRDFQQFAGATPTLLLNELGPLTELFTRKNRTSGFSNTPARFSS